MRHPIGIALIFLAAPAPARARVEVDDAVFRKALTEELARSMSELGGQGERPHEIVYIVDDVEQATAQAAYGATTGSRAVRFRTIRADVRVGAPLFDNGNFLTSGSSHSFYRTVAFEDDRDELRRELGQLTRQSFEAARRALRDKRTQPDAQQRRADEAPFDFAEAGPSQTVHVAEGARAPLDLPALTRTVKALSAVFREQEHLQASSVTGQHVIIRRRLLTITGSWKDERRSWLRVRVQGKARADDGMALWSEVLFDAGSVDGLPPIEEMKRGVRKLAAELAQAREAPVAEPGKAIVLFEGRAAGALIQTMLASDLAGTPPPRLSRNDKWHRRNSELADKVGLRIAPSFLDVQDDPRRDIGPGRGALFGAYRADDEGIAAERVSLIENGVLRGLVMSRTPRKGLERSNGHGRGEARAGVVPASTGVLYVSGGAAALSERSLRARALEEARTAGPGTAVYVVRQVADWRPLADEDGPLWIETAQRTGRLGDSIGFGTSAPQPLQPLLVLRLRDGKEELVRGVGFAKVFTGSQVADVVAVGDEPRVHNFFHPHERMGDLGTPASVVTPAVLMRNVEMANRRQSVARPLYPPPSLSRK